MTFYDYPPRLPIARLPFSYLAFIGGLLRLNTGYEARVRRFELRGLMTSVQLLNQSSDCYGRENAQADIDLAWE